LQEGFDPDFGAESVGIKKVLDLRRLLTS